MEKLPVNRRSLFITLLAILVLPGCQKQTGMKNDITQVRESNNIRNYLVRVAGEITEHPGIISQPVEEMKNNRGQRQKKFREMVSLVDVPMEGERPPLNTKITGVIQKDGYRIEKLYYESLPGLYVRGNLYIPDGSTGPRPGIIYLCGHSRTQKVHYQPHPRKFARLGFVCLIVETVQYGEVEGEHWGCYARGWFNWYSRGYTPAGVEVWNAIRGLDLLSERPEVDKEKLGATGISGGGAQAWFLAAADDRVKVVAPVCGASTMEAQITCRTIDGHCDCMMPVNTYGWDFQDIGSLIVPRPLLMAQADRDGLNQIESVRQIYQDLKKIYRLYGAEEKVSFIETPGGHSYHRLSREAIFSFFLKYLDGKDVTPAEAGDIDDSEEDQLSEEDLRVFVKGPPADDRSKVIQDSFIKIPSAPEISSASDLFDYRDHVTQLLSEKTFGAFPEDTAEFAPVLEFRTQDDAPYGTNIYSFVSEKDWRLKVEIHYNHPQDAKKPLMIVLRNPGEPRWDSEDFISGLDPEWNIAYLELRGIGEFGWAPELQWHVRRASAWTGRTLASMRVYDLLRAIHFCRRLEGTDPEKIGVAARGEMTVIALYAALMDGKCSSLVLKDPPETQDMGSSPDGRGEAIEMLNCLRITDVYQLPALIHPAEVCFLGQMPKPFLWSTEILAKAGMGNTISVINRVDEF